MSKNLSILVFNSLDPTQKDALVDIITTLLKDNSSFTIGSVIMAFNEVCPHRFDLIHPHFRKLCRMLIDADEWGQIAIMGLLLRYARYDLRCNLYLPRE